MATQGKYCVVGDDSYDFTRLGHFVEKLRAGADLVVGNRFLGGIAPGAMAWQNLRSACFLERCVPADGSADDGHGVRG